MIHVNIRSAKKNLADFEAYLHVLSHKFTIIALTESWLQDCDSQLYNLPGYEMFEDHRSERTGGGVALYVDICYDCKRRPDLDVFNSNCESLFLEVESDSVGMSRNVIIGVIYRIPNTNVSAFIDLLKTILERVKKENKFCYLLGDYNLDLLNSESHSTTGEYFDLLCSYSYMPLINKPTRVTANTATIIDNIYTNNISNMNESIQGILITDISDHYPIFHVNSNRSDSNNSEMYIMKRKYTTTNKLSFQNSLENIDWQTVFDNSTTNGSFDHFHGILKKLHDTHFPKVKVKIKYKNNKPWLDDDMKESIKIKNKLYVLSKKYHLFIMRKIIKHSKINYNIN